MKKGDYKFWIGAICRVCGNWTIEEIEDYVKQVCKNNYWESQQ